MAQPTSVDVHVDAPLTNISVAYIQAAENFIAGQVFPEIPVEKISDKYFEYPKGDWFRDEAEVRGEAAESAGSGYGVNSSATYNCREWSIHKDVPERVVKNADNPINPLGEAAEFVTQRLLVRMERLWVASFFSTGLWDDEATPSNLWSSYTSSDPITDIETGIETILQATSFMPNTLVLGYQVWRQLKHHPDIVDRYKYTSSESVTTNMLAALLELDRVLVMKSVYNTAAEGATASMAFNAGKNALLCHVAPTPGIMTPSAGYTFSWTGVSGGLGETVGIDRFEMRKLRAERVEGSKAVDMKLVAGDLGYFFDGAVT